MLDGKNTSLPEANHERLLTKASGRGVHGWIFHFSGVGGFQQAKLGSDNPRRGEHNYTVTVMPAGYRQRVQRSLHTIYRA